MIRCSWCGGSFEFNEVHECTDYSADDNQTPILSTEPEEDPQMEFDFDG